MALDQSAREDSLSYCKIYFFVNVSGIEDIRAFFGHRWGIIVDWNKP